MYQRSILSLMWAEAILESLQVIMLPSPPWKAWNRIIEETSESISAKFGTEFMKHKSVVSVKVFEGILS